MALIEEFLHERKAFSAEKSKETHESPSSDSGLEEIGNRTFKICSSASILSARERRHAQKAIENSLQDEFSPRYLTITNRENQKLNLKSSQILEKLSKIIAKSKSHSQHNCNDPNLRKLNLKQIIVHHDKLKKLLMQRSCIMLLEECDIAAKRTTKCVEDFKCLFINDKLKLMTMPIQAFNRFISSSDINISSLEKLIKKLKAICDINLSINYNYQRVINLFHICVDLKLNQAILKSKKILESLKTEMYYWSHKCINIFIQRLCLADPNSISPEFLQRILKALYVYNSLLKDEKNLQFKITPSEIFYKYIFQYKKKTVSCDLILQYLSFYEAKVAAERIVNFLCSNGKKYLKADLKRRKLNCDGNSREGSLSCIYESKNHEVESNGKSSLSTFTSNFANVLLTITQRNQSLILKYMYSITSLESVLIFKSRRNSGNSTPVSSARQMWDIPQLYNKDESYIVLEENFWSEFWSNVKKFVLKLLFDVPYHQYGDSAIGTIILWPNLFVDLLSESLKFSADFKDLSLEGRCTVREIYDHLQIHLAKLLWDKEFCSSLPIVQAHLCPPVSTSQNRINTLPGISLNKCLQVLLMICPNESCHTDSLLHFSVFLHLQATIDVYILWMNVKTRALVASQNLPSYLLVSSSDCSIAVELLNAKMMPLISDLSSSTSLKRLHPSHIHAYKILLNQVEVLMNNSKEAPIILHGFIFFFVKELLISLLKKSGVWQNIICNLCIKSKSRNIYCDSIADILSPMTETLKSIVNAYPIISSISSAVCQAFLFVLHKTKRPFNLKRITILNTEHIIFTQWLDKLCLVPSDIEKITSSLRFKEVCAILKFLPDFQRQRRCCLRRQNRIGQIPLEENFVENLISSDERSYWEEKFTKPPCSSCF